MRYIERLSRLQSKRLAAAVAELQLLRTITSSRRLMIRHNHASQPLAPVRKSSIAVLSSNGVHTARLALELSF
jgi:hypothetical protein